MSQIIVTTRQREFYIPLTELVYMSELNRYISKADLCRMSCMEPEKGDDKVGWSRTTIQHMADRYKKFVYFQGHMILPEPQKLPLLYFGGKKLWRTIHQALSPKSRKKEEK